MKVDFRIGDSTIHAVIHQRQRERPIMLNVHDDEDTSVEAGKVNLNEYGGRIIELVHSGKRLISFELHGRSYTFDPNRIFSNIGIKATLQKHSTYSEAAYGEIKRFANQYLNQFCLNQEPVIIALHNVSDETFSVESFAPGGWLSEGIAEVNVTRAHSKHDFFFVTDERFYDYFTTRNFNVVLQDNDKVPDDGSLSVHFAQKGVPYINVEAAMNHLEVQIEMLRTVREMLRTLGLESH